MAEPYPIHDLCIRAVEPKPGSGETRWAALAESDPLLRRFALAEVIRLEPQLTPTLRLRPVADEVWVLIEGVVLFAWLDLRVDSPTHGVRHVFEARQPVQVLAPFGVAFGTQALEGSALLVRIASHADNDPEAQEDRLLAWETGS